jgi:hypothetical protein
VCVKFEPINRRVLADQNYSILRYSRNSIVFSTTLCKHSSTVTCLPAAQLLCDIHISLGQPLTPQFYRSKPCNTNSLSPTATPPVSTVSTVDAGVGQNKSIIEASPISMPHGVSINNGACAIGQYDSGRYAILHQCSFLGDGVECGVHPQWCSPSQYNVWLTPFDGIHH